MYHLHYMNLRQYCIVPSRLLPVLMVFTTLCYATYIPQRLSSFCTYSTVSGPRVISRRLGRWPLSFLCLSQAKMLHVLPVTDR
uniref:Putative secreted protein n=1 Tax=Ixodes ricinus TaxID=34613 RepID=A0A6B0UEC8_IXORI